MISGVSEPVETLSRISKDSPAFMPQFVNYKAVICDI